MTRHLRRALAVVVAFGLIAAACGDDDDDTTDTTETSAVAADAGSDDTGSDDAGTDDAGADDTGSDADADAAAGGDGDLGPVALIIAQGGLGDESYNDLAFSGLDRAATAEGIEARPVEAEDIVAEGEQVLRRAAESDFGLVIDLEFSHADVMPVVAADHPDVQFAFFNLPLEGDNVTGVVFQEQEGSFLAGVLAARMTTIEGNDKINPDPVIGVIGGAQSEGIDKFLVGFIEGAAFADPEVEVLVSYTNDFGDPSIGRDAAIAMYDQGADIVYHVAGGAGLGVLEAAEEVGRYAIGVDTDQDGIKPGFVLTSMVKRADVAVERLVGDYAAGALTGGTTMTLGLAEDGVGLTDFSQTRDDIPDEVLAELDDIRQQIIDGEIVPWNVIEQGYPDFFDQ